MSEIYEKSDVPVKDADLIDRGLDAQEVLSPGGDPGDRDQDRDEEQKVSQVTDALDAISGRVIDVYGGGDSRSKFDDRLSGGKFTPRELWSTVKKVTTKSLKDPGLEKTVNGIFIENLGDELKTWGKMAKGGTVDRDSFLNETNKIAEILTDYDYQLAALAKTVGATHSAELNTMREALRAIAKNMSTQTKYIDQKGLWKNK